MEKKDMIKRLSIVYFFVFAAAPLSYFIRILYARGLTTEQYGLFYSLVAFIGLIGIFNNFGTSSAMVHYLPKFISEKKLNKMKSLVNNVLSIEVITSLLVLILIFFFRGVLSDYFFKTNTAHSLLPLFVIIFLLQNIFNWLTNFFKGYGKEALYSSMNPIRLLLLLIFSLFSYLFFRQDLLFSFSIAWIISYFVCILVYSLSCYKLFSPAWKEKYFFDKPLLKTALYYGFFVMISATAGMLLERINVLMLTYMKGLEAVALYEIAFPIASIPLILINPLTAFLFPNVSRLYFEKDSDLIRDIIRAIYNLGLFIYLPISVLLFIFPQEFILMFFGAKYLAAATALRILSIGCIFFGLSRVNFTLLDGVGQIKKRSHILYLGAGANIILNLLLVPSFGIEGSAFSTSAGFFIMFLLSLIYLHQKIKIPSLCKNWIKIFLSILIFSFLSFGLGQLLSINVYLKMAIIVLVSGGLYLLMGLKWKIVDYKLLKSLWSKQLSEKNNNNTLL